MQQRVSLRRDVAGLAFVFVFVTAVGIAFAQPWLPWRGPAGATLDRYLPVTNGDARLMGVYDAGGKLVGWNSQNVAVLPSLRGIAYDLRPAIGGAILEQYGGDSDSANDGGMLASLRALQLIEIRSRLMDATGAITETLAAYVREARGHFLAGIHDTSLGFDLTFSPTILAYPPDLGPGKAWTSQGQVSGVLDYRYEGRVSETGPRDTALGQFDDCLKVESRLALLTTPPIESSTAEWLCAGVGAVESEDINAEGNLTLRYTPLADAAQFPPPALIETDAQPLSDPSWWRLSLFAKANLTGSEIESTIPPVWLPSEPPLLLAAAYNGDLIAFNAISETGSIVRRFHTGGSIYSQPAFDPARGRIYFGSTNKRLYALDIRGLFLWSFETGDNIATRPLIAGDTVVFGSEDRNVYALDADTGELRWQAETGAAVVSSPAAAGNLVIVGSDDGSVYAYNIATGAPAWNYAADAAIEAPIVVDKGLALAASRAGTLAALDVETGVEVWTASIGAGVRDAPAVGDGFVAVVDQFRRLTVVASGDGRRLWRNTAHRYYGAPLSLGNALLAIDEGGTFHLFDRDGQDTRQWATSELVDIRDTANRYDFAYGPSVGGDAIWAVNAKAIVWRLGP